MLLRYRSSGLSIMGVGAESSSSPPAPVPPPSNCCPRCCPRGVPRGLTPTALRPPTLGAPPPAAKSGRYPLMRSTARTAKATTMRTASVERMATVALVPAVAT